MSTLKVMFDLLKETFQEWNKDRVPRLAAALSYYTIFSIAPLLIVVIAVAGLAFGQEAVQGRLDEQIQGLVGREGGDMIQEMIQNARKPSSSIPAAVIGVATLLFGAAGVFGQLKDALNTVWGVELKPGRGLLATLKDHFISFTMVLGIGFLLLVSLVLSAVLSSFHMFLNGLLPGLQFLWQLVNFVVSFGVITLLFALIYKILPDVEIEWRDVWIGAAVTALLFTIGKFLIGLYLGNSGVASTYGAAGSLVIILLWVFYSAQILLFGAEFTQVYARRYGSRIVAASDAVPLTPEARAQQGMTPHTGKATADAREPSPTPEGVSTTPTLGQPALNPLPMAAVPRKRPRWLEQLGTVVGVSAAFVTFVVGLVLGRRET